MALKKIIILTLPFCAISLAITSIALINYRSDFAYSLYLGWCVILLLLLILFAVRELSKWILLSTSVIMGFLIGLVPYEISFELMEQALSGRYGQDAFDFPDSFSLRYWLKAFYEIFAISLLQSSVLAGMVGAIVYLRNLAGLRN